MNKLRTIRILSSVISNQFACNKLLIKEPIQCANYSSIKYTKLIVNNIVKAETPTCSPAPKTLNETEPPAKPLFGVQDTFYFEESRLTSSMDKSSTFYTNLYHKIPLVIIIGWSGSNDKHLQIYKSIYSDFGFHTIRFSPSNALSILDNKKHPEYAYQLLDLLKHEYRLTSNPILTHSFSNGSDCMLYQHILSEVNQNTPSKYYNFFKQNHQSVIFDTAPSLSPDAKHFTSMFETLLNDKRNIPTLVFYSKADKIISCETIQDLINQRKKLDPSANIKSVIFTDEKHVNLQKKYTSDYLKYLKEHLELCKLDINNVLKEFENLENPDGKEKKLNQQTLN